MAKRVITSLVLLPFLLFFVVMGGWYLKAAVAVIMILAEDEICTALSKKRSAPHFVAYAFTLLFIVFVRPEMGVIVFFSVIVLLMLVLAAMLVFGYEKISVTDCFTAFFSFFYVAVMISTVFLVRMGSHGDVFVWLIFISAWGCDTGALFVGKAFGKHKLAPKLSPKKSVEGAIGGTLIATGIAAIYAAIISNFYQIDDINFLLFSVVTVFFASISGQIGDLTASAIKRHANIKDFGKIFVGHGGIMDRFDSIVLSAPTVFLVISGLFFVMERI